MRRSANLKQNKSIMSNPEGYANFEIYMIPVNRRAEPVRITFSETFDGFPTFSRDGGTFSWTSNRGDGKSQIFTADWNHDAAMAALGGAGTAVASDIDTSDAEDVARDSVSRTSPEFVPEDILRHVDYLCRPELEGRMTGSRGERMATSYVAAYLDSLGFVPAGDVDPQTGEATWFQEFEFPAGARLGENNELMVGDDAVALDDHWRPLTFSDTGEFSSDVVAFAGYGMIAPETENLGAYDSFVHLDVTDKWVMVFRFMPEDVTPEWRQERNFYSQLRVKAANVRDRGGKGLLIVSGPNSQVKQQVIPLSRDSALGKISIPVISISDELAQQILSAAKPEQDLRWWQTDLDKGEQKIGFDIPNMTITANVDVEQLRGVGRNVVGRLQFGETPHDEAVIIGAHIDHLGRGGAGSLAREDEATQIHYGADDNASGVSAMLEISQFLAAQERAGRITSGRDLVVAGWSGEELGLHGSDHFVDQCIEQLGQEVELPAEEGKEPRTIKSINSRYVAYLNMDMVGRFDGKLVLQGLGSSDWWSGEIEKRNLVTGLQLKQSKDTSLPTDATEFYQAGVPILAAFTGSHQDYHTPRDTPDKLNYEKAADIAKLMGLITRSLITGDSLPGYQEYKSDEPAMRVAMRASLGTSPDYTEEVQGVMLKSVRSNSPADKAGVQGGDVVVELAGQKVENVYDYTNAIGALKVGQEVTIVVMRDGERVELAITPESSQ